MTIDGNLVKLRGLVRWASVPPAEPKKPHEDAYDPRQPDNCHWSIEVECTDAAHLELLKLIGRKPGDRYASKLREYPEDILDSKGAVRATKTDKKFLTVKKTKIKGEYDFGTIPVKDRRGETITDVGIANDSTAIVHIVVEPVKKGSAKKTLRLKGVQVIDLIPFKLGGGPTDIDLEVFEDEANPHEQQEGFDLDTQLDDDDISF